jgi:N-acetylmuramoyl-L-alanine amidase/PA14 domain
MRTTRIRALLILGLFLPFLAPPPGSLAQPQRDDGRPEQAIIRPGGERGLAAAGDYLSAPTAAASPFTHMLLRREAHVPEGAELILAVRVSLDGTNWTDWRDLQDNDDLWQDSDGPDVEWSETIDVGATARFWQVRGEFKPAPNGELPVLRRVDVNTVDTRAFAPTHEPSAPGGPVATLSRPGVVSRSAWGCPDGQGSRATPDHYPVNHMVVHHTADSNTLLPGEPNWAARVRAEWSFHTYTRGWGDVGYNYLIDPNGVIYEGRAGGDDAVAFHDTANYGSMGVVVIGTYATVPPTPAAQNALVKLLAWKADQKGINPLGSSYYYGCARSRYCYPYNLGAIVPNIAGHRQVTPGHTSCPGDQTMAYLSGIRNRVAQALSGAPVDNGDLTIDEFESGFTSSGSWHEANCGFDGHTYWTYATDNQAESGNSATWRPNIPTAGLYHVYAHVPQGCGLAPPPYASAQAKYTITYAGGATNQVTVDQNTTTAWVDLGAYQFDKGTSGRVALSDLTGEPFDQQKIVFFDAIRWERDSGEPDAQISVAFDRTTLASGELLKVTFTVRNTSTNGTIMRGQAPRLDLAGGADPGDLDNGYVYDQDECFNSNTSGSYPAFPKEDDRFRVVLGMPGWDQRPNNGCTGPTSNYPWRWGLNADLRPGQQQTVVGYVRFRVPGAYTVQAGLIQEYVKYFQQGISPTPITVTPERTPPDVASYDAALNPLAHVYQLVGIPDNFLARTHNPLSITRGAYLGSFAWNGAYNDWGAGGPLPGLADNFIVEQVRSFIAPVTGEYTFGVTSDDGAWLWVDGALVIDNSGLHDDGRTIYDGASTSAVTETISLGAGPHILAFKYFERSGLAAAGYGVQMPGEAELHPLPDGLGGAPQLGRIFVNFPTIRLPADDTGGAGIDHIAWSLNGAGMPDTDGPLLETGKLQNGEYHLIYQAVDKAGNQDQQRELTFTVNTAVTISRVYLPIVAR